MSARAAQRKNPRGRPQTITRERLVEAAIEMGLVNLTLAGIARRLGITVQSIYNYVKDRDELVKLTADVLAERFPMPEDANEEWKDWIYKVAYALKRTYEHAPGIAMIIMSTPYHSAPHRAERWETALKVAARSGFCTERAIRATLAVQEFTLAWVAREDLHGMQHDAAGSSPKTIGRGAALARELQFLYHKTDITINIERFDFTLRALIDGLFRARNSTRRRRGAPR
jgi:AcrR family transcriptional regulator